MSERELNRLLVERFPELTDKYNEFIKWMGEGEDTGSHNVYGDVFNPYIEQLFEKKNHKGLKKVFKFIEDVLALDEDYSGEVIITVLEHIEGREDLRIAKEYFGELTNEALLEINEFWTDNTKMKNILVERSNYEKVMGVIKKIEYSDKYQKMYIEFSDLIPDFDRPIFMLVDNNLLAAMENGMNSKMKFGDTVEFITLRNYRGAFDDERPIVALSVNGEMLLEFEDGYANFLKWLKVEI